MNRGTPQNKPARVGTGRENGRRRRTLRRLFAPLGLVLFGLLPACRTQPGVQPEASPAVAVPAAQSRLEKALYERQEFFGAEALVPLPTARARENVAALAATEPDDPQLLEKLAELDEKLGDFDSAEKSLARLAGLDPRKLGNLAAFYDRRGRFQNEAEVLRQIFSASPPENRAGAFERLIGFARKHDLKGFLKGDFYAQAVKENPDSYAIFEKLIDDFAAEKNYAEALRFARQAKEQFPQRRGVFLEKEIGILLDTGRSKEAETVYLADFDPLWSDAEAGKFYSFLSDRDRLRAYGSELKSRFEKNPADFDAAVRFALYRDHDYTEGNDAITPVILKLERAKKAWTTEELFTVTRMLLRKNEAEAASRFLYTLHHREEFRQDKGLRAKLLYQLFEMFSDAENQKLPLTKGDLRFYEDVAKTDTSPGIATGILSLIFSDTEPQKRLAEQEKAATKYFNRAAAYRIFLAYKEEFSVTPELAQMYLDVVRLYTATGETEIAEATLNEFAARYENSTDYPDAALKLADAYVAAEKPEKAREVYQKILDHLGKQGGHLRRPERNTSRPAGGRLNSPSPEESPAPGETPVRNRGINIPPGEKKEPKNAVDYSSGTENAFHDFLGAGSSGPPVTYPEVLARLVGSLAREKKTAEILALFSNEIQKYPDEEWLYEQRLSWLEQTNLLDDQLQVYQSALARFQTRGWQDKLARWLLRQKRHEEFAAFSQELVAKLNDAETAEYLAQFGGGGGGNFSSAGFERHLFLKLYRTANARFPHNHFFVKSLLGFYKANKLGDDWRRLAARYYFESKEVREQFLDDLAEKRELRPFLAKAEGAAGTIYELFRADAAVRLSDFENALATYRKLSRLYPNEPEFSERLITLARSLGQKDQGLLNEAAAAARARANFARSSAAYRTLSGEIYAELGLYEEARREWEMITPTAAGEKETYLEAATLYWDYYQYDDALRTIKNLREKFSDEKLYAFETGAILEARHQRAEALAEYVRALGAGAAGSGEETGQREKAEKRLLRLCKIKTEVCAEIDSAFWTESRRGGDSSFLTLGYAGYLAKAGRPEDARAVLYSSAGRSTNQDFLEAVRDFYQSEGDAGGEQFVLRRLSQVEESPRRIIAYRLQLAGSLEESRDRDSLRQSLRELVGRFPTNYGVITEAADFYFRAGFEDDSVGLLETALARSRGKFRGALARNLTGRLIRLNRLDQTERILLGLHAEDPSDVESFRELAKVFVLTGKPEMLRKTFAETLKALRQSDEERRPLERQIAELRRQLVGAFTRLGDHKSAVEQHIEIINREPENEALTEDAIAYVRRHGGAQTLVDYYLKTSAQGFKNYRWNLVLARIYEATDDWPHAAESYRAAIVNQPEMAELHAALAAVEARRNNFDEALKSLDTAIELAGETPEYVKKKIELLGKLGRAAEAETERAKLPGGEKAAVKTDEFAEARRLAATEKDEARRLYREAFGKLFALPLGGELKAADITGYVRSLREEEPLDRINERLWELRARLIELSEMPDSPSAGEARKRISILDGALTEAVGGIARIVATDEELAALYKDLRRRAEETSYRADRHRVLPLVQDLSRRAGFGDLEEMILRKKLEESTFLADERQVQLQALLDFYNERGAYHKTFEVLERYEKGNPALRAETARLVNDREKELEALREIYRKGGTTPAAGGPDKEVARYLEMLYAGGREELKELTKTSAAYQLQLINFLLGKGLTELAHAAIESADLPPAWKVSRHAETSLALREFGEDADCYFCTALEIDSIGNLISRKPDKERRLVGDDWFRLSREYGEWLLEAGKPAAAGGPAAAADFLVAMTENQPRDAAEQFKLGEFYLRKGSPEKAAAHFRLALELNPADKTSRASLGAAYYLGGRRDLAEEAWAETLKDETPGDALVFFQSLQEWDLGGQAREKLPGIISKFLGANDADTSEEFQNLVRALARSFGSEAEKAAYFLEILRRNQTDTSLAEMLVGESLLDETAQAEFYELLIDRSAGLSSYDYDYDFAAVSRRVWSKADAEVVYDRENDYPAEEPDSERYRWQMKYLALLLGRNEDRRAALLISRIEKELSGRFARPPALRLAGLRLQIRSGNFDPAQFERFIGISASDSSREVRLPSIERLNDVLRVLKSENREAEMGLVSEAFFARMLALDQYEAGNLLGLARVHFRRGETEMARRILQLMIDAGDETKWGAAAAEIAAIESVKARSADARKLPHDLRTSAINRADALRLAAEISAEFGQAGMAVDFRSRLTGADPADLQNLLELAKLLGAAGGKKEEAAVFLRRIIASRDAPRPLRWQARMILRETDRAAQIPDVPFDSHSQYFCGLLAKADGRAEVAKQFFLNALVARKEAEEPNRDELIRLYALSGHHHAALKLSEKSQSESSEELLVLLSASAEKVGEYRLAKEFEKARSEPDKRRLAHLERLDGEKSRRATEFTVDLENTRRL